tara:strand:- start:2736 stop:2930 length:195 start_codon:yes stop_codon:yes gene_type:complete
LADDFFDRVVSVTEIMPDGQMRKARLQKVMALQKVIAHGRAGLAMQDKTGHAVSPITLDEAVLT